MVNPTNTFEPATDGAPTTYTTNNQDSEVSNETQNSDQHSSVVASHYNHLKEKGLKERFNSPIFYLRNFNNWVKSVLIQEYVDKLQRTSRHSVLDICCGKGGDLSKWQKARIDHVIFADIAEISVEQCKTRYEDLRRRCGRIFTAEFISADCTKESLRNKYRDPSIRLDLVSCQFGLHYSFESYEQARCMLANISECLKPNGYFIGTIPNAYEIVTRAKKSSDESFGNRIFKIKLLFDTQNGYPLFGAKYDFNLEGVVDCPEFLVNFSLLQKLALEYGLELVYKSSFADFFTEYSEKYKNLLQRIISFETYPAPPGKQLIADELEYEHAKQHLKVDGKNEQVGTMSTCEWEAVTIYMAFAFKKCESSLDSNGKPIYHIKKDQNQSVGNENV